jgi:signal transduction histidine kinase/CheY-like chemotaxis protein
VLGDPLETRRARLLVGLLLMLVLPLPLFTAAWAAAGLWGMAVLSGVILVLFAGVMVFYQRTGKRVAVTQFVLISGTLGILGTCLQSGGLEAVVTPYLCLVPLLAFVLISPRWGWIWASIAISSGGLLLALELLEVPLPPTTGTEFPFHVFLNLVILTGYAFAMALFLAGNNKLQREQLEAARERAEQASAAKSRFLANMSHELRTPMNGVTGLIESMLHEGDLSASQVQTLQTVQASGRMLMDLVDDLLDLSKAEADLLKLERVPVHVGTLANEVIGLLGERARLRGNTLTCTCDPALDWTIGDPARLRQVLLNLVGNAVKFTAKGHITVEITASNGRVQVRVQDTGEGISVEQVEHLFEPFAQADASTTRRFGGSGLGLTISRRLVNLMQGELCVESELGVGSTFGFDIPMPPARAPAAPALVGGEPPPGLRILVAEDNHVNQLVIQRLLETVHAHVVLTSNGVQALQAMQTAAFDVVLMDVHMPEMDGLEAMRQARRAGYTGHIVAVSASALVEDRKLAHEAGADAFLAKPMGRDALCATLIQACAPQEPAAAEAIEG